MRFAYLEMLSPAMLRIALTTVAVAAGVLIIIGPIGTYNTLSPMERLVYGVVCTCLCFPICYSLSVVTAYYARSRSPLQIGLAVAVVLLIASVPCASIVYTFQALFYPEHAAQLGFLTIYSLSATATVACHVLFHFVLCQRVKHAAAGTVRRGVARAVTTQGVAAGKADAGDAGDAGVSEPAAHRAAAETGADGPSDQASRQSVATTPVAPPTADSPAMTTPPTGADSSSLAAPDAAPRPPFFDRLLPEPGGDLVFLKTDGRYVQVHTTTGSSRMIARFADAVVQLGDLGMQVHRSYWVAHRHATELVRRDSHTLLRLTGGREVPVGRTYLAAVRAAFASRESQVGHVAPDLRPPAP